MSQNIYFSVLLFPFFLIPFQISKFPLSALDHLPALTWLTLRGNYIESVPHRPLQSALNEEGDMDGYGGRHGYGMPR